ncbi:MAG: hypothetical protein ACRDSK_04875 [Actinophytocola sp.]|uniref:hypothetical protein n=1 Tax=Actinophytocola sp. TaxID=1872138 RepID=UPI003D6C20C3
MNKQLFDEAIGEAPPSSVDVDTVIARGRRAVRVRRVASPALAAVAVVAVVLFGVAVVAQSDGDADGFVPAKPPSSTTTTPTSESICAGMTPTAPPQPEKPAVTENRLTAVLTDSVSERLPEGATLEANPDAKNRAGQRLGPLETYHWYSELRETPDTCVGGEDEYISRASVRSPNGVGNVFFLIARAGSENYLECDSSTENPDQDSCDTETTPNGDVVMTTELGRGQQSASYRVDVLRADQTFVLAEVSDKATSSKYPGPPDTTQMPLTREQLKEIALDPALTMYPK